MSYFGDVGQRYLVLNPQRKNASPLFRASFWHCDKWMLCWSKFSSISGVQKELGGVYQLTTQKCPKCTYFFSYFICVPIIILNYILASCEKSIHGLLLLVSIQCCFTDNCDVCSTVCMTTVKDWFSRQLFFSTHSNLNKHGHWEQMTFKNGFSWWKIKFYSWFRFLGIFPVVWWGMSLVLLSRCPVM